MIDLDHIRNRYRQDPLPFRLGGLAADLARVASFSHNPAHLTAVSSLLWEAAHFVGSGVFSSLMVIGESSSWRGMGEI